MAMLMRCELLSGDLLGPDLTDAGGESEVECVLAHPLPEGVPFGGFLPPFPLKRMTCLFPK